MAEARETGVLSEEGYDPMELLPEEIWEYIFELVRNSPKTLINCCKVSTSWDQLLSLKKTTWIFGEIFPLIFPYLKNEDILRCREICKSWRYSVDNFIEDHPCHHPSAPEGLNDGDTRRESVYYPLISKQLHQIRFNDSKELTKFRLEMEHTSKNPIIGRSICFYSRPQEEWMMNALHFLSEFGRHIWFFTFESFHLPVPFVQWLRQCLILLPNLKKLRIYSCLDRPFGLEANPELSNELMTELRENPFPPLPFLETLEVLTKNLPIITQDTIISTYGGQIQRFETDVWNQAYINQRNYPLTDLKELTLKIESNDVLDSLSKLNYPFLKKLTLFLKHRDIDLYRLSSLLWSCKENLQVLKITLAANSNFIMSKFLEAFADLELAKLKVLVLVNAEDLPYNFLRGMKSVEYLHFEKWRRCQSISTEHLAFVQMKGHIPVSSTHESEDWVWNQLPALKRLIYYDVAEGERILSRTVYEYNKSICTKSS